MKRFRKVISLLLVLAMLVSLVPATALATNKSIVTDAQGNYEIVNEQGETTEVDGSWEEEYPYGTIALGHHQVIAEEGGETQILTVHRLGGTVGKVSAVIQYVPAVVETEEGGEDLIYAVSHEDIRIEVEDPLPIAEYQAWGEGPAPEPAGTGISARSGVDEVLGQCTILSANTLAAAEDYEWFALYAGDWQPIEDSNVAELPVGDEIEELDYRCEYTLNGIRYCSDSYRGVAYEKPEPQVIPEAPADLELNPEKTYTLLDMTRDDGASAWLFEVCFAEGETEKEIRITALEDELPEMDEMATFTIVEHIGGEILQSMNTAILRIADNDTDKDPPAQFGFSVTEATFDKAEGTASLTVQRTGGLVKAMSVDWTLEDGTAVAGVDYAPVSGSLNFYGHESEQVIEIPLINDQVEDLTEKEFTVRLHSLKGNGTDASCITEEASICTVRLYNSNTAENLNLASVLQNNAVGVDVSANLTVEEGAQVSNQVLSGAQVDGDLPVEDNTTVEWETEVNPNLRMYQYNGGGKISFSGGDWVSTTKETLSISSNGEDRNTTTKNIANMGALYRSISASVSGGAGLCNWWDRMWHGNNEFAYTYFRWDPYGSNGGYKDCSPKLTEDGSKIHLSYKNPFSVSDSLPYKTGEGSLTLGVAKNESCPSEDNINAAASVTLTRRTFNNDFKLNIYTANDPDTVAEVAKYDDSDYSNIIQSVSIINGGTNGGKLYEGSSVQIQLGNTHLTPVAACLVDASGTTVMTGTLSGTIATFNNIVQDPNGSYTFYLVLDRNQDIKIDLSTSANILEDGSYAEEAFSDAYALLLENSETDTVTVGYTARNGNDFDTKISEKTLSLSGRTLSGSILTLEKVANLQWINFNMPETDSFVLNGKAYRGNEKIPLNIADIKTNDLQFYYYAAQYKTVQRPMNVTLDATAIYYDGNANGRIDGYFDRATGNFMLDETSGDEFITYPEDGDYAEPMFAPMVDEDGKVHQYFFRPYYTANPVSLEAPEGKENEKMQVRPAFITDVTDPDNYAGLTAEQQQYRLIVSGETGIRDGSGQTTTGYSADDHAKYGAEASVYSYVDIPLGGDASPAKPITSDQPDGRYNIDGRDCVVYEGYVYSYSADAPDNLGKALYEWTPDYRGNLLYPFADPEDIIIPHTMVQDEYPLQGADLVNSYLGSFGDNDTFALMVCEQTKTTGEILAGRNLRTATADDETPLKETVTRGAVGSYPDPEPLTHMTGSTPPSQNADNSSYTEYDEVTVETKPDIFSANGNIANIANISTSGYTIAVSIGVPVSFGLYRHDTTAASGSTQGGTQGGTQTGTQTGSKPDFWQRNKETIWVESAQYAKSRISEFAKALKGGKGTSSFAELYGEEMMKNKLHFASFDFSVFGSVLFIFEYNALDNDFKFKLAGASLHCALTLTLRRRLTPAPCFYVYSVITVEFGGQGGLEQLRVPEYEPAVISDSGEVVLYTSPESEQAGNYTFTADKKAFEIDFTGKLYVECFNFTDSNDNGVYDPNEELGDPVSKDIFKPGKITSDGEEPVTVEIQGRTDGFSIDPVVVKLTPIMESASDETAVTIRSLAEICAMTGEMAFSGITIDIGGSIEVGAGAGMELLGGEVFGQASIGIVFTLLSETAADSVETIVFDSFTVKFAMGFRVSLLFFNYQMDVFSYTVGYDETLDDNGQLVVDKDGWYQSWSALGDQFGGAIEEFSLRHRSGEVNKKIQSYVDLPDKTDVTVSTNGVAGPGTDLPQFYAFDTNAEDFQVSGYGSVSNAFRLMQGGSTGYDYQIVTVNDRNYVVYTGSNADASAMDNTELWLSKLEETDDVYGFVNPIAESTDSMPYIPVEGDGTGDLEFHAWAEGEKIHVIWVSYADAITDEALAEGDASYHLKNSAYNTEVKHAVFDTADTEATGFGAAEILSAADVNAYYFQPHMAGGAAVVARSVPYSEEALKERMNQFEQYLTDTEEEVAEEQDPNEFIAANREFRLNYQQDMWTVYGGNSVLSVSVPGKELTNNTTYVSRSQVEDPANANEIITNLDMTEIDGVYYLSYVTQQDILERDGETYTDLASTYRFYLRTFTIDENNAVVWGEPYLLRTLVDREQNNEEDGIYSAGARISANDSPNFGNLQFLSGRLGDSLKGTTESFRTASVTEVEDFLLFEMNGDTYVIQEKSLKSITGNDGTDTHTGTLAPFFTAEQYYQGKGMDTEKARANGDSIASGKGEVVIGADGDGNLAAVYTAPVSNTVNNAIYISYWDPGIGSWSDGVMLAMNHMDVYEQAAAEGWTDEETKAAYYDEEKGGGLDQFTFSNLQIALGRKGGEQGEVIRTPEGDEILNEINREAAETIDDGLKEKLVELLQENGVSQTQIDAWFEDDGTVSEETRAYLKELVGYRLSQRAETLGLETDNSASAAELLILTQGTMQRLAQYKDAEDNITVAPARDDDGTTLPSDVGIYAISYGKGNQQVGDVSIRFSEQSFNAGNVLDAYVDFTNVGDAAIRGSEDQPVTVRLMLSNDGASSEMAVWEIPNNISAGQKVELDTEYLHCAAFPGDLGYGDYFYITVEEDAEYIEATGGEAYHYDSASDPGHGYTFDIEVKPELGIENLTASVFAVDKDGNPIIHLTFDTANHGSLTAKDPWLQFSYAAAYDEDGEPVYVPLDLSESELYISRQQRVQEENPGLRSAGINNLRQGIVMLQGTEIFDRKDYYITKEEQRAILYQHYSPNPVAGWTKAGFGGQYYWYDADVYDSFTDAYDAGKAAIDRWEYDLFTDMFYNGDYYHSVEEAKQAAEADCKAEYILTEAQYSQLAEEEKAAWHRVTNEADQTDYYVPTRLATYEEAWQVFQIALNELNNSLFSHFVRQVEAYVKVSPEMFNGPLSGNMDLQVELFSEDTSTSYDGSTGLYTSGHEDEYDGINNVASVSLEQTGFIIAPKKVTLNDRRLHYIPVHIRTTTEVPPLVRAEEIVEEGQEKKLQTLFFTANEHQDQPNVLSGYLTVIADGLSGDGVIHIVDESTNTTHAITFHLASLNDYGINFSRTDPVIFRNVDGTVSTAESTSEDWSFPVVPDGNWTANGLWVNNSPRNDDVAIGRKGAAVSFFTTANQLEFHHSGSVRVSSGKFDASFVSGNSGTTDTANGTATITGDSNGRVDNTVSFDGPAGELHKVTLTVISDEATLDYALPSYRTHQPEAQPDPEAPGIYWNRIFPTGGLSSDDKVELIAYVFDEAGLERLYFNGEPIADGSIRKYDDHLWSYSFTVDNDLYVFQFGARNVNGRETVHDAVTANWYGAGTDSYTFKSDFNVYKGDDEYLYSQNSGDRQPVYILPEDADQRAKFWVNLGGNITDDTADVYYYKYDAEADEFVEMPSDHTSTNPPDITGNGYYMVRVVKNSTGAWDQKVMLVDCFETRPEVSAEAENRDGTYYLNWTASRAAENTATIESVTVNGYEVLNEQGKKQVEGAVELAFGGDYTVKVTDSKGITAETTVKVSIPVNFPADAVTVVDNWSADSRYPRGEAQIDVTKLSGGIYDPSSITRDGQALPPTEYTGRYGYELMAVTGSSEDFSVEEEIISRIEDFRWSDIRLYPVKGLKAGNYALILQCMFDQENPDLIAWQRITVEENPIKITSIEATPSLGTANRNGTITATFEGGHTGAYEAAILPGNNLKAADFKVVTVTWKSADADGKIVFENLDAGTWQLAVRAKYVGETTAYSLAGSDYWCGMVIADPIVVADGKMISDEALQAAREAQAAAEAAQLAAEKAAADARVAQAAAEEAAKTAAADKTAAESARTAAELAKSQAEAAKAAAEAAQVNAEAAQKAAEEANAEAAQEAAKAAQEALDAANSAGAAADSAGEAAKAAAAAQSAQAKAEAAQKAAEAAAASGAEDREGAEAAQRAAELAQAQAEAAKAAADTAQSKAEEAQAAAEAANVEAAKEAAEAAASANESAQAASAAAGSAADAAEAARAAQDARLAAEKAQAAAEEAAADSDVSKEEAEAAQAAAEEAQAQAEAAQLAAESAKAAADESAKAAEDSNVAAAEEAAKSAASAKVSAESAAASARSAQEAAESAVAAKAAQKAAEEAQAAAEEAQKASETAQSKAEAAQAAAEAAAASGAEDREGAEAAQRAAELAQAQAEAAKAAADTAQSKAEEAQAAAEAANVEAAKEAAEAAASANESAQAASAAAGSAADAAEAARAAQDARLAAEKAQAAAEEAAADSDVSKEEAEAAQAAAEEAQAQAEAAQLAAESAKAAAEAAAKAAESSNVEAAQQAAASAASAKASAESAAAAAQSAKDAAQSAVDAEVARKAAEAAKAAAEEAQKASETARSKAEAAQAAAEAAAASSAEDREGAEAAQRAAELAQTQAEAAKAAADTAQSKAEEAQAAAEAANVKAAEEAAKSAASANGSAQAASAAAGSAADAAEAAKAAQDAQLAAEEAQAASEAAAASAAADKSAATAAKASAELAYAQAQAAKAGAEAAQNAAEIAAEAAENSNVEAAEEAAKSASSAKASAESAAAAAASAKSAADSAREAQEAQARAEEAQRLAEEAAQRAKDEADRIARESELNLAKTVAVIEVNELLQELLVVVGDEYRIPLIEAAKTQRELLLAAADQEALEAALTEIETALRKIAAKRCADTVFADIDKSAWYHDAVDYVLNEGMMNGTGDGNFAPDAALSRAMLVQILYNIEGRPAVETELAFSDVAEGAWYYDAVMWAAENGIVQGTGNGTFAPEREISREQMVTILYRYAGSPEVADLVLTFADAAEVSDWAKPTVAWAAENGIVQGVGGNRFAPAGSTTRAAAAQVMMNYFGK